jgi:hypothetical protein
MQVGLATVLTRIKIWQSAMNILSPEWIFRKWLAQASLITLLARLSMDREAVHSRTAAVRRKIHL